MTAEPHFCTEELPCNLPANGLTALFVAMVDRAIKDELDYDMFYSDDRRKISREAKEWLDCNGDYLMSYRDVCDHLGVDSHAFRMALTNKIKGSKKYERSQR